MYDIYIYASYTFTAFALGAIIAVSFHGLARARQRLAALQDTQNGDG
ncbi:MAG: heme exporter protein CcmD [Pseudomonadota bacterium]|nr:heme exporter protein CcmD [Pseudomonadota bacterium]